MTLNSASSSNPLTLRISNILATTQFDHPSIPAALDTLNSITNQSLLASTQSTSDHVDQNSLQSSQFDYLNSLKKGGLRRILEQRMRDRSKEFLNVFSELNDNLIDLQSHLDHMHECCEEVQEQLSVANSATKYLLEHANGLRKESQEVATQQLITQAFLHRFTLSDEEVAALTRGEIEVSWSLFEAMDHCEQIRSDCASLLTGELQSPQLGSAGLDIMQTTSKYLDKAFEKLLKWSLFQARSGLIVKSAENQPEVSPMMKRAISRLMRLPESFNEVIHTLTTARSRALLNLFLDALTRGGPSGLPRPIELNAHDPIRYVGDILAWIHQMMASEHEFLESLFDLKSDDRRVGESRIFPKKNENLQPNQTARGTSSELTVINAHDENRELARKLVDKHLEGCIRPMKLRVQQTVNSQESSLIACQLANLLEFYDLTMSSTIGPDAKLTKTLHELTGQSYQVFYQLLKSHSTDYLRHLEPPPIDLSAPVPLHEAMSNLSVIMSIYDGSAEEPTPSEYSLDKVLDLVIDPMLEVVDNMARLRASESDRSIFWLNCLEFMLATVNRPKSTSSAEKLQSLKQTHLEKLIHQYTAHLVSTSGLEPILRAIETKDKDTPLSRLEETNSKSISEALRKFDKFLMNFDHSVTSNKLLSLLNPLSSTTTIIQNNQDRKMVSDRTNDSESNLKKVILKKSLNQLILYYSKIYNLVLDDSNLFEFKSTILIRSIDEVKTLIDF